MRRAPPLLALGLLLTGCGGRQSTLRPNSHASRSIEHLWWVMFVGAVVVCAVVIMLVLVAALRSRARRASQADGKGVRGFVLISGFVVPLLVLVALFGLILSDMPVSAQPKPGAARLTIDVVGRQWFWEVRYPGRAVTANEIHIPVGRPVVIDVTTDDVIHSFWVPALNRKIDAIPAKTNRLLLEADRPGLYRGQCAEFCGFQHANMGFLVYADPPDRFREWLANLRRPARVTGGRGFAVFTRYACAGCHTIRGTPARGDIGPDLTHLAGRSTIAAATIPNRRGYLGGWILDSQHIKPRNKMPPIDLTGPDLQVLLDYLGRLK